ncbi:hypothetical protein NEOLEDRAFT_1242542 [Neolentinus lepideus HHB14362 ss-1]|uniref:FAD/NAD(P)-binding domain-containing protein n=1 Tax=Neolentinus lepideus HHB14362 ss-1 TaxID=1314782 RepID=A0A165RUT4_9AGAM|nr:hypothetical protein NEOLEDRAFT_1242542 [Neolentinus lepideus HHB14362 ss-1]
MTTVASVTQPHPSAFEKSRLDYICSAHEPLSSGPEAVNGSASSSGPVLQMLDRLGVKELPKDVNALDLARKWMDSFEHYISSCDVGGLLSLLVEDAFWRDILTMTWDFRTFQMKPHIRQFILDLLSASKINSLKLDESMVELERPYPDLTWIHALFKFETDKAHLVLTALDELEGFPEKIGHLREQSPNHGKWQEQRRREMEFRDEDPKVLVAGAGHAGLEIAARLKYLDIPTLVVERHPRVEDNWRTRYEYLHLHTLVGKLRRTLTVPRFFHTRRIMDMTMRPTFHSHQRSPYTLQPPSLELDMWTSSEVIGAEQDKTTKNWIVTIRRLETGQERTFTVNHLICAIGWAGRMPKMPVYPGMVRVYCIIIVRQVIIGYIRSNSWVA